MSSLRLGGVHFQVFPEDHEPPHVHAARAEVRAVVHLLDDRTVAFHRFTPPNAKTSDLREILFAAREYFDALIDLWEKMHP